MIPAMSLRAASDTWTDYDALRDVATLTLGTADQADVGEMPRGVQVAFDHHQRGRLVTVRTFGAATIRSQAWRTIVAELLGEPLWDTLVDLARHGRPLDRAPLTVPDPSEATAAARQWRHAELRRRLDDPFPVVTPSEPTRWWQLPQTALGKLTLAQSRNAPTTDQPTARRTLELDPDVAAALALSNQVHIERTAADSITVTASPLPGHQPSALAVVVLAPGSGTASLQPTSAGRYRADVTVEGLDTDLSEYLDTLELAITRAATPPDG